MTDDPDAALVLECRAGDRRAFDRLLARYQRPIFNAAYRILNHREDATDVTQTAFLRAYEHFDRYDPGQRFFSWIYRIAVNEALDVSNGRRRTESVPEAGSASELASDRPGPERVAQDEQSDTDLQAALMELPVDYRTLIVLKHVQDCSYEEIGAILECPLKTVKSRLFTARQALREVLLKRGWA
jgi:RNA polymerase sigma-70 factor (ECF subfamily)